MRSKIILSAIVATAGLAAATAAPALADETDDTFIGVLESEGVPFSTPEDAIALAEAVCEYVAAGQPAEQVAVDISGPANWSVEQSGFFVGAATQSYCPS
ncbi:hypothetical protein NGTWS0302_14460 [Mycolicibacterium cyprinidarum]|uniref:DUF732 domain-containing protein n=1 Tax=Mycolicibacterium cyprinidarum TaxID=2860311 RepID=A0ABQ4V7X2_9MYCO|nr:hypothetical protein NGTWS1803_16410 [Mycolicibacterium sp. NGTWS1803]GJF11545.1 hypothetical protein NGTWS1702_38240 [Mycolicibacterium sp. NGTWSNA01]GJF17571.1 hypothetical protein NGTWS0302_14460 [Mycolicibacterium sp. NGTWS0302]